MQQLFFLLSALSRTFAAVQILTYCYGTRGRVPRNLQRQATLQIICLGEEEATSTLFSLCAFAGHWSGCEISHLSAQQQEKEKEMSIPVQLPLRHHSSPTSLPRCPTQQRALPVSLAAQPAWIQIFDRRKKSMLVGGALPAY